MSSGVKSDTVENQLDRPPGASQGRGNSALRGRQATAEDLAKVRQIIGPADPERSLLLEYLHQIQDVVGSLRHCHLAALAECIRLSQAEVYEVATFYHRFQVAADDAAPIEPAVHICCGLPCQMAGADKIAAELETKLEGKFRIVRGACMGRCDCAPVTAVAANYLGHANAEAVQVALSAPDSSAIMTPAIDFYRYQANGGYDLLRQCLAGQRQKQQIIYDLTQSGLRGLGGAGFPTGRKWGLVAAEPGPRYLVVNGDESEPGTFKDRYYLERDPHRFIEGVLLAAWAMDAVEIYFYLRDEYPHLRALLQQEFARVTAMGLAVAPVRIRRGAGAYICGEESAMLESIEGKRGMPRQRPPFPSEAGLFGRPTLINNVETLYWARDAINAGAAWPDMRSFSVSGRVREPGVKHVSSGITARALIEDHCGGMLEGHDLAAFLPGGASGGILPANLADEAMDFGSLEPHGGLIGSAALIVLSQHDDIADVVGNLMRFFAHESCGQCTPCRVGTEKAVMMLNAGKAGTDGTALADLAGVMADASICGLGQAAASPLRCALRHFPGAIA